MSGQGREIDSIRATGNQKRSRKEFFIPLEELFSFFQGLRESGQKHLGIYHSHPRSECLPSARDVAEFHYREVSYWIVSLQGEKADIGCFLWDGAGLKSVSFRVVRDRGEK